MGIKMGWEMIVSINSDICKENLRVQCTWLHMVWLQVSPRVVRQTIPSTFYYNHSFWALQFCFDYSTLKVKVRELCCAELLKKKKIYEILNHKQILLVEPLRLNNSFCLAGHSDRTAAALQAVWELRATVGDGESRLVFMYIAAISLSKYRFMYTS